MNNPTKFFETIYDNFNKRNIEFVIDNMTTNVKWANGMEGGYVYGHNDVREYWTRQFQLVSSKVTPTDIKEIDDHFRITVHQIVHDLEGNSLADETVPTSIKRTATKSLSSMVGNRRWLLTS